MDAEVKDWIDAVSSSLIAMSSVVGVAIAWYQLHRLNQSMRLNSLLGIVQLEVEIDRRRAQLIAILAQIKKLQSSTKKDATAELSALDQQKALMIESYLNVVDRLAFCFRKSYFRESEWRAEYRSFFETEIATHKSFFEADSRYTNIIKLNEKWNDE